MGIRDLDKYGRSALHTVHDEVYYEPIVSPDGPMEIMPEPCRIVDSPRFVELKRRLAAPPVEPTEPTFDSADFRRRMRARNGDNGRVRWSADFVSEFQQDPTWERVFSEEAIRKLRGSAKSQSFIGIDYAQHELRYGSSATPMRTDTGRMSSSGPEFQRMPSSRPPVHGKSIVESLKAQLTAEFESKYKRHDDQTDAFTRLAVDYANMEAREISRMVDRQMYHGDPLRRDDGVIGAALAGLSPREDGK